MFQRFSVLLLTLVLGTWKGTSLCTEPRGACHDETVVFEITPVKDDPKHVHIDCDKIIDGERGENWDFPFTYDPATGKLEAEFTNRRGDHYAWRFTATKDAITGTLERIPDGRVMRNLSLKR